MLGTQEIKRIEDNIYNRWTGSLIYLQNLTNLLVLDINTSDISEGLEYLPTDNLVHFTFGSFGRREAGVKRLQNILLQELEFDESQTIDEWAAEGTFITRKSLENCNAKVEEIIEWQKEWREKQLQTRIQMIIPVIIRRRR